jgi:hypothetical protein
MPKDADYNKTMSKFVLGILVQPSWGLTDVLACAQGSKDISPGLSAMTIVKREAKELGDKIVKGIQDKFNEAGMEIMSPHYKSVRDGNRIAIPDEYIPDEYATPSFRVKQEPDRNESP